MFFFVSAGFLSESLNDYPCRHCIRKSPGFLLRFLLSIPPGIPWKFIHKFIQEFHRTFVCSFCKIFLRHVSDISSEKFLHGLLQKSLRVPPVLSFPCFFFVQEFRKHLKEFLQVLSQKFCPGIVSENFQKLILGASKVLTRSAFYIINLFKRSSRDFSWEILSRNLPGLFCAISVRISEKIPGRMSETVPT